MMFMTAQQMRAAEDALFAQGVEAEDLMNLAGLKIAREILKRFPSPDGRLAIAVIGKGNNGADAMVALRHLKEAGWQVAVRSDTPPTTLTGLPSKKWQELGEIHLLDNLQQLPENKGVILLDGLLGIGTEGSIREPLATLAREMNALRQGGQAFTVAIDVPSGINCDTGECGDDTVIADLTCTLGMPKQGLIADAAISHVGSLAFLSLPGLSDIDPSQNHLICPDTLPVQKLYRPYDFHKGEAGRIGIVAGSRGLAGTAALCSLGALKAGGGLVTLFVPKADYPLILSLVPIEVMVKPVTSYLEVLHERLDALAIGPGLGLGDAGIDVLSLISQFKNPTVIDADALNLIARRGSISQLRSDQVVTPHPGEITRLLPDLDHKLTRAEIARRFAHQSPATLLFKGARTIVTSRESPLAYNTTGTPGMATGGQGDVLTGVIAALLARGLEPIEAASMGAWLSGRASEIALQTESQESLTATTTAQHLGRAFQELRATAT
jgi:ADP-dependent NAD(P)H-hydrate dehydratase / NAD(P)H-hydrate epimerase